MARRILFILIAVYAVGLAVVAFWPVPVDRGIHGVLLRLIAVLDTHGLPFVSYAMVEFTANVVLFLPLGLLLAAATRRGSRLLALAFCIAASLAIELGQAVFLPERFASPLDLLANSLGAAIGVAVVAGTEKRGRSSAS